MVKSGQVWSGVFVSLDATGALATPSVGPAGVLYVDGTANGAAVTISGSNPYKWSVTLPTLTAGQCVSMYVTATIAAIATASVVAEDVADTVRLSDTPAVNVTLWAGDAVAGAPALETTAQAILEDTGTTLPGLIAAANPAGSGAISFSVTVNDESSNPVDGVEVWISTDSAGASVVAGTLSTDALGLATFMLDAGTYYLWRQRSGYNFTNPVTIVVS